MISGEFNAVRCCFDADADKGEQASAMMVLTLSAEGPATSVRLDKSRSTALPAVVQECLGQVLMGASYPSSPANKTTIVEYLFTAQRPPKTP